MIDVEIILESTERGGARKWRVEVRSLEPMTRVLVDPLVDADLAAIAGLPADGQTWAGFLALLSPNRAYAPPSSVLRAVGSQIMSRVLGHADVATHLTRIEARAAQEGQSLRFLVEVLDNEDPLLALLPLELAHDGTRFFFKRSTVPSLRCAPYTEVKDLRLPPGARVLIVTAHADHERVPDRASLLAHAEAIAAAVRGAGFEPEHLPDAATTALHDKLTSGPRVHILYIACHGQEERTRMGQLVLRDDALYGEDLGRWLEEATELGRQVQLVALCACSSAVPQVGTGTSGMAQWLVYPRRALATLGFRAPILVTWALSFSERLFARLGQGASVEDAFAHARFQEPDGEPQWPLALLYGRRREPVVVKRALERGLESLVIESSSPGLPVISPPLPRKPRAYFTGRVRELAELHAWIRDPGTAQITAVEGQGGIGKSELGRVIAHEERATGRLVIWLERADKDVIGAMGAMIRLRTPGFQAAPEASEEDLAAILRRDLGPYRGLLVLDDIADRAAVDRLTPSGEWNVLVTTRVRALLPGCREVEVRPLEVTDALMLLSRVAWDADVPPDGERDAATRLVERLGRLPLALELAGATLRNVVTAEEYLAALGLGEGVAASDSERVNATLLRSLSDIEAGDERVFLALGILPAAGATGEMVATTVGESAPPVVRRLDRLVRHNLATWSPELGRYLLHPLLREAASGRARRQIEVWAELHRGAAEAIDHLREWIYETVGSRTGGAYERWATVSDIFDAIEPAPWLDGAPGGDHVAMAIAGANVFRADRTLAVRDALLMTAVTLSRDGDSSRRAFVLQMRGELRLRRDDLVGAAHDYDAALSLYETVASRLGQANVRKARGELRLRRDDFAGAAQDYDAALLLYDAVEARLGQANVLKARGEMRMRRDDFIGATEDYNAALSLFQALQAPQGQANVLHARGTMWLRRADLVLAGRDYDASLLLFEAVKDRLGQANVFQTRGDLRFRREDLVGARQDYDSALSLYEAVEDRLGQANVLQARGVLERRQQNMVRAGQDYDAALSLFDAVQDRLGKANVLHARGELRLRHDDVVGAEQDYDAALSLYVAVEDQLGQANVLHARGDLERGRNALTLAHTWYERAMLIYRSIEDAVGLSNVLAELARNCAQQEDNWTAERLATEALQVAMQSENSYATDLATAVLSKIRQST